MSMNIKVFVLCGVAQKKLWSDWIKKDVYILLQKEESVQKCIWMN